MRPLRLPLLLLVLATLLAYAGLHDADFVNYDDPDYVTQNAMVRKGLSAEGLQWAFTEVHSANWHPLTWLSHMLDVQLFGLDAGAQHMVNVGLHLLNSILVLLGLYWMTGHPWRSFAVAALFAVHPAHVESVAWISERKDVLSTLFWLLATGAWIRWTRHPTPRRYALVALLMALGLLAKAMLVTLPFALVLLDRWPLRRERSLGRLLVEKLPLLGLSLLSAAATFLAQSRGGAVSSTELLPLDARWIQAVQSVWVYLGKLFWPSRLSPFYPHPALTPGLESWPGVLVLVAALALVALVAVALLLDRRGNRVGSMGGLWYLGTLIPVIGLVQVGPQAFADRYTYLPSLGVLVILVWGLGRWSDRRGALRPILAVLLALGVGAGIYGTRVQAGHWNDSETLFRHAIAVTERNWLAHNNLGNALYERGAREEALEHYSEATRIRPDYTAAHFNRANALVPLGRTEDALAAFARTLELDPEHVGALNNRGDLLARLGRFEEAAVDFEAALRLRPDHPPSLRNLAQTLERLGRPAEAAERYRRLLRRQPEEIRALHGLARCLLATRPSEALAPAERAARLSRRGDPHVLDTLASAYLALGRSEEAHRALSDALRLVRRSGPAERAAYLERRLAELDETAP